MSSPDREDFSEKDWTPGQREAMKGWQTLRSRDRGERRIANWIERQNKRHDWVCFADIADWWARKPGGLERDEGRRAEAYAELQESVLSGELAKRGRLRIRYLPLRVGMGHPHVEPSHKLIIGSKQPSFIGRGSWPDLSSSLPTPRLWLDQKQFRSWIGPGGRVLRPVLMFCWAPRTLCLGWFNARKIDPPPWLVDTTPQSRDPDSPKSKLLSKIKDEKAAVTTLTALLRERDVVKVADALKFCRERHPSLSGRGFQERVWPKGREAAGLPAIASAGRKRKTSR
jgi:hypothetical protein